MDKLLEITPYPINTLQEARQGYYSKTLVSAAPDSQARSLRGNLFVSLTSRSDLSNFDLVTFTDQILAKFWDEYFTKSADSIPQALARLAEEVVKQAESAKVEISLAASAIWGEIMIAKTLGAGRVFLEGKNETLEFTGENIHQERISNGDKIILLTVPLGEEVKTEDLHILLRAKDLPSAAGKFKEALSQAENPARLGLLLLDLKMLAVPSEEERIEILETPNGSSGFFFKKVQELILGKISTLTALTAKLKAPKNQSQPPIYLRPHLPSGKKGKLFLVLILVALLVLGAVFSRKIGQRNQEEALGKKLLTSAEASITEAKDTASLDSGKTKALLKDAKSDLTRVKGLSVQKSEVERVSRLWQQTQADLYKILEVEARPSNKDFPSSGFSFDLRSGVSQAVEEEKKIIITPSTDWVEVTGIKEYLGNLYLLDKGAFQIWKYLSLGSSFSKNFAYFKENIDLSDISDWAIDGSVFILRTDGRVEKFLSGKKQEFRLSGLFPDIKGSLHFFTNAESESIYLSANANISIFNKDGFYIKQLKVTNIEKIDEMSVSERTKIIWLKSNGRVYQLSLP